MNCLMSYKASGQAGVELLEHFSPWRTLLFLVNSLALPSESHCRVLSATRDDGAAGFELDRNLGALIKGTQQLAGTYM